MMTREQIIASAEQVISAIDSAGIIKLATPSSEEVTLQEYLIAYKQYNISAEKFTKGAQFLENELGFSLLRDPDPWITMSNQNGAEDVNPLNNLKGIVEALSSITNLLKHSIDRTENEEGKEILSLIVLESNGQGCSTPRRLSDALESIELLYEASARLQRLPFDDIEVLSCDSGENKLFDVQGKTPVIANVKELILSIWERVVFYRNRDLQERISLLTHSLPVLDRITELEMNGSLSASESELIRIALVNGVKKFLSSRALIREIRDRSPFDETMLVSEKQPPIEKEYDMNGQTAFPFSEEPLAEHFVDESQFKESEPLQGESSLDAMADDLSWDGILEDDLKTLRELIDKTKRNEEDQS